MFESLPDDVIHEICERFPSIVNLAAIASVSKSCVLSQDARSLAANFPTVVVDLQAAWRGALVRRRRVNLRRVSLEPHLDSFTAWESPISAATHCCRRKSRFRLQCWQKIVGSRLEKWETRVLDGDGRG